MPTFPIKNFRPIEAKEDATDQDRTVLRLCDGLIPVPQGALSAPPIWGTAWGISDLGAAVAGVLASAAVDKAHFVRIEVQGRTILAVWSKPSASVLGLFEVKGSESGDFTSSTGLTISSPTGAAYRDKDPAARWYASRVGKRIVLGNGVDENLAWTPEVGSCGGLNLFGPTSEPNNIYTRSRVRIPPCTSFRMHVNRSLFAAGNALLPMRVWITDPPNAADVARGEDVLEGIYSEETSFIDIHPHKGASRITTLSVYMQYVTVHTDQAPVNVFGVDQTSDGFKCEQSPSAAGSSAPNPDCVADGDGDMSYYLGSDGEIYADQAVRGGPFEKRGARDQDIVTSQAAGVWNREMAPGGLLGAIYDRTTRLLWIFATSVHGGRRMVWSYHERTRSISGPIHYPDAGAFCRVLSGGTPVALVATRTNHVLFARLASVGERQPHEWEPRNTPTGSAYAPVLAEPAVSAVPAVGISADRLTWAEKHPGGLIGFSDPSGPVTTQAPVALAEWYPDAHIARFETVLLDFGAPDVEKEFLDLSLTFERGSRGVLGVYAETDSGRSDFVFAGQIHPSESVKVPIKVAGARIRFRLILAAFNGARVLIRDAVVGFNPVES